MKNHVNKLRQRINQKKRKKEKETKSDAIYISALFGLPLHYIISNYEHLTNPRDKAIQRICSLEMEVR